MKNKKKPTHKIKKGRPRTQRLRSTGIGASCVFTDDPQRGVAINQFYEPDGNVMWQIKFSKPKTGASIIRGKVRPTCLTLQTGRTIHTTVRLSDEAMLMLEAAIANCRT